MNKTTKNIKNNKNFDAELELIEEFNSFKGHEIIVVAQEDTHTQSRLSKNGKTFHLEINERIDAETEIFSLIIESAIYEAKDIGSTFSKSDFKVGESATFLTTFELNSFHSQDFNHKSFFKAFFPVELKEIKTFHSEFETITYQKNGNNYFYDCLRIRVNNVDYDVTQLKTDINSFYIFECLVEQTFEEFSDTCFSISQAIGFINRFMVGDEKFVFDISSKLYYSNLIRPTIKGMYNPIITNPYSYLDIEREAADRYVGKLTRITLENLSNLANKIHNDSEFSTAIIVILEVTSIRSLLLIPSSFAVIIELLSKNLSVLEIGSENPIIDKSLKNKILKQLHEVIDRNKTTLTESSILKLKRRLNDVNKPINKQHLTNNEILTRPFEQLGIDLSLHDIEIIEHRNDLLHGNILLKKDDNRDAESLNIYMSYVSAKLFTLISKLILTSIGYNGYIYNQAKYLEKYIEIETDEEYFEKN
jgi:hypothetical protein